ncbi:unnamed protein product [Protopolystoma xenopodis]|uniref:Major facilitator superfamily (MFS) profile domain-containing protein n=1 Tax=Protopolystoma xenopodis TaxID=117903 RepID=A0A448WL58_9PLAT|nr:unnamed protein product [Protopolystoma xenopodis]
MGTRGDVVDVINFGDENFLNESRQAYGLTDGRPRPSITANMAAAPWLPSSGPVRLSGDIAALATVTQQDARMAERLLKASLKAAKVETRRHASQLEARGRLVANDPVTVLLDAADLEELFEEDEDEVDEDDFDIPIEPSDEVIAALAAAAVRERTSSTSERLEAEVGGSMLTTATTMPAASVADGAGEEDNGRVVQKTSDGGAVLRTGGSVSAFTFDFAAIPEEDEEDGEEHPDAIATGQASKPAEPPVAKPESPSGPSGAAAAGMKTATDASSLEASQPVGLSLVPVRRAPSRVSRTSSLGPRSYISRYRASLVGAPSIRSSLTSRPSTVVLATRDQGQAAQLATKALREQRRHFQVSALCCAHLLHQTLYGEPALWLLNLSNILTYFSVSVCICFLPSYGVSLGLSDSQASQLLSYMGITMCMGRITCGLLAQFVPVFSGLAISVTAGLCLVGLSCLLPFMQNFVGLSIYALTTGVLISPFVALISNVIEETMGAGSLTRTYGSVLAAQSVGYLIGGPMAGNESYVDWH